VSFWASDISFKSVVTLISTSLASPCALNPNDVAFHDIAKETMKNGSSASFTIDPLPSSIQNEVNQYLNKNIFRCVSTLVWSFSQPAGFIVAFVEGAYRSISQQVC
jgi:hypothetical protein